MSEEDNMKTFIKKRASIKAKLTQFDNYLKSLLVSEDQDVDREVKNELNQRINYTNKFFTSFDEIQNEIEYIATNVEEQYREREEFENKFHKIVSKAKALLEKLNENDEVQPQASSVQSSDKTVFEGVKLPEIKLPKFDGSYENWMEFRDTFESLIHTSSRISEIQKYHYLRASLVGAAPLVIQSLEFSGDNYSLAWNTLCDRFNNKHLLIQNHLKSIFHMENINVASASKLRHIYESLFKHLNSLKLLGEPTESWDTLLIFIISNKLDKYTAQEWEKTRTNHDSITLDIFKEFLKKRANLLESLEMHSGQSGVENKKIDNRKPSQNFRTNKNYNSGFNQTRGLINCTENTKGADPKSKVRYTCYNCNGGHLMYYCPDFLQLGIKARIAKVRELKLCLNCLKQNHAAKDCKWSGCKHCGNKHNSILHEQREVPSTSNATTAGNNNMRQFNNTNSETDLNFTYCGVATSQNALLATARVAVYNKEDSQKTVYARALLDCGGQSSFMTRDLCEKLSLSKMKIKLAVAGISDQLSYSNYKCEIFIRSLNSNFSFDLSCFVLDKITSLIPDNFINAKQFGIPDDVVLADPNFNIPQPIDILIGADAFWHILNVGQVSLRVSSPILQNTRLGWIVVGPIGLPTNNNTSICNLNKATSIQNQLAKFWEVEETVLERVWSDEERACEEHFNKNLWINHDGRFVVALPFKKSPEALGQSREIALKRFLTLERKLLANKKLYDLYKDFLNDYEQLGHMTDVSNQKDDFPEYYMPHHGVLKESSSTSKLRVVFDASCLTSTGLSLNNLQMIGPIIQQDLLSIILRFRTHSIVVSSDIKMMYRQVLINPDQRKLQKILWRSDPNDNIKTFQLNTITYGTTAASFLAIRCLHEIANECEFEHPKIAEIIRNDMYVDDLLSSVDNKEEAQYICKYISQILLKRGFELRKWKSNDIDVIKGLNAEPSSKLLEFSADKEPSKKILGLLWDSDGDMLSYKIQNSNNSKFNVITKRVILSRISTIFDPLGLISPCIITAKVLLQRLWEENLSWDQEVPARIRDLWLEWSSDLNALNNIKLRETW